MGEGRKRNAPCWCGSERKFKHCHLNREHEEGVKHWEVEQTFKKSFSKPICSAPEVWHKGCDGRIVRAHTVPRSSSLKRIARDGHVYGFVVSMQNLKTFNGKIRPELVGIKKASTFSGFCMRHDNEIFSPIENSDFEGTAEQCFLLGYRAEARELYTKTASASLQSYSKDIDAGRTREQQAQIQEINSLMDIGVQVGLNDNLALKAQYDEILISKSFENSFAYVIELDNPPSVMCSGGWFPTEDNDGNVLQNLGDLEAKMCAITCTSYWGGQTGLVIFQWLSADHNICERYIRSIHAVDNNELPTVLLNLFFDNLENLQLAPDWWEGLSETEQNILVDLLASSANPFEDIKLKAVIDPGWRVQNRYAVGFDL